MSGCAANPVVKTVLLTAFFRYLFSIPDPANCSSPLPSSAISFPPHIIILWFSSFQIGVVCLSTQTARLARVVI